MIHLSTPGECPISVRVDDLSEQERMLVRETLQIIKTMSNREGLVYLLVTIEGILGVVGMIPILVPFIPKLSFLLFMAYCAFGGAVVGFLGWLITRPIVNSSHDNNALFFINLRRHARCGDLIREYSAGNPWFKKAIKRRFEQAATAQ